MVNEKTRTFQRLHNGILIYLSIDQWPQDIPLPEGTGIIELGDGPFRPYRDFILKPDKTIEKFAGWFIVPNLTPEETVCWYQTEMGKLGWIEIERSETRPEGAILRYRHPEPAEGTETYVVISIMQNKHLKRTQPMIRRVTIHPWSPPEDEEWPAGDEHILPDVETESPVSSAPEVTAQPGKELSPVN